MKNFLSHEWSAIKSDFREHPIFSIIMCCVILFIGALLLYVLFADEYIIEAKSILIFSIILLFGWVKQLKRENSKNTSYIEQLNEELKEKEKKLLQKESELFNLKEELRETKDSLTEEIITSAQYRSTLFLCAGESKVKQTEKEIENEIGHYHTAQFYKK